MNSISFTLALLLAAAQTDGGSEACCLRQGLDAADRYRVAGLEDRRFDHERLWSVLGPLVASPWLRSEEIGRSLAGRAIRSVTFGTGPTTVLLWSQMHGDESTATMALADLMAYFAGAEGETIRDGLARALTVVMVPMLNPDGAQAFRRENGAGIDVNRDARRLVTPEARALKGLRDRLAANFGFNLHDQDARTRAGRDGHQVALAFLPPASEAGRSYGPVRRRARLVAARIIGALEADTALRGRLAKYDDTFEPRAFGDLMQAWGTSTVLIESGSLPDDPQKQRLRAFNVAAILTALHGIATGDYERADPDRYETLPENFRVADDVYLTGGFIVFPSGPVRADLVLRYDDPVARRDPRYSEVGDLERIAALDTVDVSGLYLHPSAPEVVRGQPARFTVRRGVDPASEVVMQFGGPPGTGGARRDLGHRPRPIP